MPDREDRQVDLTISEILHGANRSGVELDPGASSGASSIANGEQIVSDSDKYDVKNVLAQGGMGMVVSARDINIRRNVAVKLMLPQGEVSEEAVVRFVEEAQVTGQLEHPNIVPVHELGVQADGQVFYAMKMIKGRNLDEILSDIRGGDKETIAEFHLNRLITLFMKVCDALAFAHSRKVIHRDLKPENIMIGDFGEVLVVDWGLAKILKSRINADIRPDAAELDEELVESIRSTDESGSMMTLAGQILGTPRFMAPEQALGKNSDMDCRSDIYALGAILYNILALQPHIESGNVRKVLLDIVGGKHVPIADRAANMSFPHCPNGKIPVGLQAVVEKCLLVDPADRYQNVKELQADIESWQEGFATDAEDAGLMRQLTLLVARHKGVFVISALALLVLSGMGAVAFKQVVSERDQANAARQAAEDERAKTQSALDKEAAALAQSERLRQTAEDARKKAVLESQAADAARSSAEAALQRAEKNNYYHLITVAASKLQSNALREMDDLLDNCPESQRHWEWGFLKQSTEQSLRTIDLGESVYDVQFLPQTASRVALRVARRPSIIAIVDWQTGKRVQEIRHSSYISQLSISKDEAWIVGGKTGGACVWDVATGDLIKELDFGLPKSTCAAALSADKQWLVVGSGDSGRGDKEASVAVFDTATWARKWVADYGPDWPPKVAISPSAPLAFTRGRKTGLVIRDLNTGKEVRRLGDARVYSSLALSPDGLRLVDGTTMYETKSWQELGETKIYINPHSRIAYSPDSKELAIASRNDIHVLRADTGEQAYQHFGHRGDVHAVAFSSDGRYLAACGGQELRIWQRNGNISPVKNVAGTGTNARFLEDGALLLTRQVYVSIKDPEKIETRESLHSVRAKAYVSAVTTSGTKTVIGTAGGWVQCWDRETGKMIWSKEAHTGHTTGVAFSDAGDVLVTCSDKGELKRWDPLTGAATKELSGQGYMSALAVSPDGKFIVAMSQRDATVRDAETFEIIKKISVAYANLYQSVRFSRDGRYCAVVSGQAKVLNATDWTERFTVVDGNDKLTCATFSADGRRLVTAGEGKELAIHSTEDGQSILRILCNEGGRESTVRSVDMSHDNRRIVLAGGGRISMITVDFEGREDLMKPEGPSGHKVLYASSEEPFQKSHGKYAADGDPSTFWHSEWRYGKPAHPHELHIDLGAEKTMTALTYLPRQDAGVNGMLTEFDVYVSSDLKDWGDPAATAKITYEGLDRTRRAVLFERPATGRFVRIVTKAARDGGPFASAAEFDVEVAD